ncbi:uncharacterized protein ACLA_097600 [Aspergillus clavatus NRRL 1]|uniref:DUF1687 domain protein n=1 Tax=Aspergillus clavatus (strain ATCC 1007 / CBS 513.65 / DSM 816 / NCTC 3887 / NRRL 1 / QM 1276 / 107) TaxID=344612 RepID=A1CMN2_ASPCL|nr:uncharacterized protein ACLA_097600 [Aspergillus clavatus NRRL 1]EAW08819.1 conserved hypothetical protein [Aspergillus clavatus NRRL 1]
MVFRFVSTHPLQAPISSTTTPKSSPQVSTSTNKTTFPGLPCQPKSIDPITLFHSPSLASSQRAHTILKQAASIASETATEDQASDYLEHAKRQRGEFSLEVTTAAPTADQLRNILDYVGGGVKASQIVTGAKDAQDALELFKKDQARFVKPVTVDWTHGKAVIGDNESEILKMVHQLDVD